MSQRINWSQLTPLKQNDNQYEPQLQQIIQYASFIGFNFPYDEKFLYLAKEGLKASLPPFWQACQADNGQIYFRNKKTRAITTQNPLDQIYIQKFREIKELQAQTNIYTINEESAINEVSALIKSRPDLRVSQKQNNAIIAGNKIMERHITQESMYSDNVSAEKTSPRKSLIYEKLQSEQFAKQRLQLLELKRKVDKIVPTQNELITTVLSLKQLPNHIPLKMGYSEIKNLFDLKVNVQNARQKLQRKKGQKRELQNILEQLRANKQKSIEVIGKQHIF